MTWFGWLDQALTLVSWQVSGVIATLLSYLGARSLAVGERGKRSWAMVFGGVSISVVMGLVALFVSLSLNKVLPVMEDPARYTDLSADWGNNMSPEERERSSLIRARMAYTGARKVVNYVDQSGTWKPYCPTSEDAERIAEFTKATAQLQAVATSAWRSSLSWWISGGIALLAGLYVGRRAKNAG